MSSTTQATLCVANLSSIANAQYLERLFSAYGEVQQVEMFDEGHQRYAEVTFHNIDDADAAIAALHCRYHTSRNLPMITLYSKRSPNVSRYGHLVGKEFRAATDRNRLPSPIALDAFDVSFERGAVKPPPSEREFLPDSKSAQPMADGE